MEVDQIVYLLHVGISILSWLSLILMKLLCIIAKYGC